MLSNGISVYFSFLSILLTAVLTHHPSWVATVMPSGNVAKRSYLDKHTSNTVRFCLYYGVVWCGVGFHDVGWAGAVGEGAVVVGAVQ